MFETKTLIKICFFATLILMHKNGQKTIMNTTRNVTDIWLPTLQFGHYFTTQYSHYPAGFQLAIWPDIYQRI